MSEVKEFKLEETKERPTGEFVDNLTAGCSILHIMHEQNEDVVMSEMVKCISDMNQSHAGNLGNRSYGLYEWKEDEGLFLFKMSDFDLNSLKPKFLNPPEKIEIVENSNSPIDAFKFFMYTPKKRIYDFDSASIVFRGMQSHFEDPVVVRWIKEIAIRNDDDDCLIRKSLIFLYKVNGEADKIKVIQNAPVEINQYSMFIEWSTNSKV